MPATPEEATAALAPSCQLSTLADLIRLACMTDNKPALKVPSSFFFHSQDRAWLLARHLIRQNGFCYAITERGINTAEALRCCLKTLHP